MSDRLVLVGTSGVVAGRVIPISDGDTSVGRAPENGLVLDQEGVSRFHARLRYDNGTLWIQEAGSRNGVFVNGQRIADHKALRVGDAVRIADCELEVRWDTPEPPPQPPPSAPEAEGKTQRRRWFWR